MRLREVRRRAAGESKSESSLSDDELESEELEEEDEDEEDEDEEDDEDDDAESALLRTLDSFIAGFAVSCSLSESSSLEDEEDEEDEESSEDMARVLVFLCRLRRGPAAALPDFAFAAAIVRLYFVECERCRSSQCRCEGKVNRMH